MLLGIVSALCAQTNNTDSNLSDDGFTVKDNTFNPNAARDSLKASHKKVPKGIYVWTVDERFGDITPVARDTSTHLFMNQVFTTGLYGEYNTTGNLGAPRINRIATDRNFDARDPFTAPYSYFITKPSDLRFTNTLSPITNLYYTMCGNSSTGEDHLKVSFATNINKRFGAGFRFNYIYAKGYYQNMHNSLFNFTFWTSYIGARYQLHYSMAFNHLKITENGGITDDAFVSHPEEFKESYAPNEMPTVLSNNWNNQAVFNLNFAHRYSLGFYRKVPMTEMEKDAKRFALKSKAENDSKKEKKKSAGEKRDSEHAATTNPKKKFTGRPDNAAIMGDLPKDAKERQIALQDSAMQHIRDSIVAAGKETEDTSWMKKEYVPVTSFIHTLAFVTNDRQYSATAKNAGFYLNRYNVPETVPGDSIDDHTQYYCLRNTFALGMLEGFNKWVPLGLKAYITHEMMHYRQPNLFYDYTSTTENSVYVGGEVLRTTGRLIHFKAVADFGIIGQNVGDIRIDGTGDIDMHLFGDTSPVKLRAFYHLTNPNFVQRHYCGRFFYWDHEDDFGKQSQLHLEGEFYVSRTKTRLRACYDNINNYVYLGVNYNRTGSGANAKITGYTADMRQAPSNISLLTIELEQNLRYGILNWENRVTYQTSSQQEYLAVPALNVWTNLYLKFKLARVLSMEFGGDMRYFTAYEAPIYCPMIGQYGVFEGERTKTGNCPVVDVYLNMHLKKCRFFIMMSGIYTGGNRFFTPHYPLNTSILRFGLSWDFNN